MILLCLAPDDFSHQREIHWVLITGSQLMHFFENCTLILLVKLLLSYTRCSCCILNFIEPKCKNQDLYSIGNKQEHVTPTRIMDCVKCL